MSQQHATLQEWAETIPLCAICGSRHDLKSTKQEFYHVPRQCEMCGQAHRPVDFCPAYQSANLRGLAHTVDSGAFYLAMKRSERTMLRAVIETDSYFRPLPESQMYFIDWGYFLEQMVAALTELAFGGEYDEHGS